MLTRNYSVNQDFDPVQFETQREQIFHQTEKQPPIDYEIDSDSDWYGKIYRIWNGRILLGTFHQRNEKWIAEPFYENGKYIKLDCSLQRSFSSDQKAIAYIVGTYQN